MDENEQKALHDIGKYGCHILQVMEEDKAPPFSYSIGIATNFHKPDLCVVGLKERMAKFVINEYVLMLKDGEKVDIGNLYSGFLEGFDVCFEKVDRKYFRAYFGWSIWYYKGLEFQMLQLIYPTTFGIYPWEEEAPQDFIDWQTILTKDGKTVFQEK